MSGSAVWKFFEITEDDDSNAKCKICNKIFSRGKAGDTKNYGTSSLIKHLKSKHEEEFNTFQTDTESSKQAITKKRKVLEGPTTSQPTIDSCFERVKLWDINSEKSRQVHYKIGEMIAIDNLPFSVVNNIGFRNVVKQLEPRYVLPSRPYFTDVIIPDIYDRCVNKTKNMLRVATAERERKMISITCDGWTCSTNNESFMSLSAHWLKEDFTRVSE